jgi:hypothetical protein
VKTLETAVLIFAIFGGASFIGLTLVWAFDKLEAWWNRG